MSVNFLEYQDYPVISQILWSAKLLSFAKCEVTEKREVLGISYQLNVTHADSDFHFGLDLYSGGFGCCFDSDRVRV